MADKAIDGKTYLTPKEAATYLRRSPSTLEEWRRLKRGPRYHKLGPSKKSCILYHRHDLDTWMARHAIATDDEK